MENLVVPILALLVAVVVVLFHRTDSGIGERVTRLENQIQRLELEIKGYSQLFAALNTTLVTTAASIGKIEGAAGILKDVGRAMSNALRDDSEKSE